MIKQTQNKNLNLLIIFYCGTQNVKFSVFESQNKVLELEMRF